MKVKTKNSIGWKSGLYLPLISGLMFFFVLSGANISAQSSNEVPANLSASFQQILNHQLVTLKNEHQQYNGAGRAESNIMLIEYYEYVIAAYNHGQRDVNYAFVSALELIIPADGLQGNRLQRNMFNPSSPSNMITKGNDGSQTAAHGRLKPNFRTAIDAIHLNHSSGLNNVQAFIDLINANK